MSSLCGFSPGFSNFFPHPKDMHVWLIGNSDLSVGVSLSGSLSLCGPF